MGEEGVRLDVSLATSEGITKSTMSLLVAKQLATGNAALAISLSIPVGQGIKCMPLQLE